MPDPEYERIWGKGPHVAVDIVVLDKLNRKIVLIRRKDNNMWALPGGFIEPNETINQAARRELREETNLHAYWPDYKPEISFVVDNPLRDPRSHIISFVYTLEKSSYEKLKSGDDAKEARWFDWLEMPQEIFADHRKIIDKAIFG